MPISLPSLVAGAAVAIAGNPTAIVAGPAGGHAAAYVTAGASVIPIDVPGPTAGRAVDVGTPVEGIALSGNGSTVWVTTAAGWAAPVDMATGTVGQQVHVGGQPGAIVIPRPGG